MLRLHQALNLLNNSAALTPNTFLMGEEKGLFDAASPEQPIIRFSLAGSIGMLITGYSLASVWNPYLSEARTLLAFAGSLAKADNGKHGSPER